MAKILVGDDDDLVRGFLQRTLERAGYEVTTAADGLEGLARRNYPEIKMIAISGGGFRTDRDFLPIAAEFGADRTLSKPLMPADLLNAVKSVLG